MASICCSESSKCSPKIYKGAFRNQVCVCNATYCDQIEPLGYLKDGKAVIYRSDLDGDRLRRFTVKVLSGSKSDENVTISVNSGEKYQEIYGFGGAFTDATGINLASLDRNIADKILEAYFTQEGLEYNIGRVPIASTDFSTREYSYADVPNDFDLQHFALADEDYKYKIPYIQKAQKMTSGNIRMFASPWSCPGWMKVNGRMRGGGEMKKDPKIYQAYANYFVKFFEEYLKNGIPFWGVTVQNEPSSGADITYRWQTLNFTDETMRDFLMFYLGPTLKSNKITKDLKVMILDDGRILLPGWADTIFNDPIANQYADGVAVHWYGNLYSPATTLDWTNERHPDKFILATEACAGYFGHHGPIMGDWFRAESYADDIITDLNHHVTGWTDWNLCLDEIGGPNWAYNVVDAPIIVNKTSQEFYKQPMFYALGHFSKFFPKGSRRIGVKVDGNLAVSAAAVSVTGGRRSIVVLNKSSSPIRARLDDTTTGQYILLDLPPRSIHTANWQKPKTRKLL
ncbi:unnamed protein product [Caenorhabditis bovis]|uniref:Glucosylceramidase n=1 Tax=Caenorhabditis bovis TaxID=2654633 RepID=A0A8S1F097_9PELO|nr:unnamed protein product [Caenorhabditis bovis]